MVIILMDTTAKRKKKEEQTSMKGRLEDANFMIKVSVNFQITTADFYTWIPHCVGFSYNVLTGQTVTSSTPTMHQTNPVGIRRDAKIITVNLNTTDRMENTIF